MFERKFEVVVQKDFESCLGRIAALKNSGCLGSVFHKIESEIQPRNEEFAEFTLRQPLGNNTGTAIVTGNIERIDELNTRISGIAHVDGIIPVLIILTLVAVLFVIQDIYQGNWWFLVFTLIWYPFGCYQFFYYRNRLIKTLEKAVLQ